MKPVQCSSVRTTSDKNEGKVQHIYSGLISLLLLIRLNSATTERIYFTVIEENPESRLGLQKPDGKLNNK